MLAWPMSKTIVFLVPFALLLIATVIFFALMHTVRSRRRIAAQYRDDPDIHEWLIAFNWSRKVLYAPTIVVSIVLGILAYINAAFDTPPMNDRILGGIWLAVFLVNFLVDEYEMSVKILLIGILVVLALLLWLVFLGWLMPFLRLFRHLGFRMDGTAYMVIAAMFAVAVVISWLRGLYYYVAMTPMYMNIQAGPTESGEQVSREDYSTRIDTGDFLERIMGFGRVIITFRDQRRQPVVLLVRQIGRVAAKLESIRGKLALDSRQDTTGGLNVD
jgi:hypothetical protein